MAGFASSQVSSTRNDTLSARRDQRTDILQEEHSLGSSLFRRENQVVEVLAR
jgi:hypothetical protein